MATLSGMVVMTTELKPRTIIPKTLPTMWMQLPCLTRLLLAPRLVTLTELIVKLVILLWTGVLLFLQPITVTILTKMVF